MATNGNRNVGFVHRRIKDGGEISWIELFADLVFVAALIQIGSRFLKQLSLVGLTEFALAFALIWWSWMALSFHLTRRQVEDVRTRILVFLFVFSIGNLAIVAGRGLFEYPVTFLAVFAVTRAVIALLYLDLAWRGVSVAQRFGAGFGLAAALWALGAFAGLWLGWPVMVAAGIAALTVDVVTGTMADPRRLAEEMPTDLERLSERFGQMTLIVIGESFIKTIGGLASHGGQTFPGLLASAAAFVFIAGFFWSYFGDIAGRTIRAERSRVWSYLHLPLLAAITGTGVMLEPMILRASEGHGPPLAQTLLHVLPAVAYLTMALIDRLATADRERHRNSGWPRLATAVALLLTWPIAANSGTVLATLLPVAAILIPLTWDVLRRPDGGIAGAARANVR